MKLIRYRILPMAAAVTAFLLSGCGLQDRLNTETDDYVYMAEAIETEKEFMTGKFTAAGEYLYYMEDQQAIKRVPLQGSDGTVSLAEGEFVVTVSGIRSALEEAGGSGYSFEDMVIQDFAVDSDGSICCILTVDEGLRGISAILNGTYGQGGTENAGDGQDGESEQGLLYKRSPGGETAYWLELPFRVLSGSPDWLALDGGGGAYVLTADAILAVDGDGRVTGSLPVEQADSTDDYNGMAGRLLRGGGGRIYYIAKRMVGGGARAFLLEHGSGLRMTQVSLPYARGQSGIYEGTDCLLMLSNEGLFRHEGDAGSLVNVLQWAESGLVGSEVAEVTELEPERYLVRIYTEGSGQYLLLTKTPRSEVPEKETIVIASLSPVDTLQRSVVEFNRVNDKYNVVIEAYGAENDAEGALLRLDAALLSGNTPDLLDLTGLSVSKYAEKGMLEDLGRYIDQAGREGESWAGYPANLLEGFTVNGRLVCIPRGFAFSAVFSVTPESRTAESWTVPGLMELSERFPDNSLFAGGARYLLMEFCAPYYLERFIDWEEGTCSFDSAEFRALLEWAAAQDLKAGQPRDALFLFSAVTDFESYLHTLLRYGTDTAMYGYPTADGGSVYIPYVQDALGMLSSGNKEGAWEFLRCFLEEDLYRNYWFSTRQDLLDAAYLRAVTPSSNPSVLYPMDSDKSPIEYYSMEPEQADIVKQALEAVDFTPRTSAESSIIGIIWEEAQHLLNGSKDSEAVARTIQNRAKLVLAE